MKLKHIFYTAAAMAMLSFQACTLDEDTSGISNPDDFFRKFSECQSVVNGCYIPIKSIYTYTYMIATECVTDIAYCPSGTLDASLDISPAVPRMGSTVWRNGYLGVQRCNFAVNGIERAYKNEVISEEQYHQLLCEAKTLRAFFYWTLTCFFGNVPFYFDDVTDNEVLSRIQVLPRMDANETRNKVIEDLQSIAPLAAQTRTYDNEANRLGASCAYMLIAKMAMWNKQWDVALDALEQIETIYGPLSQYDYAENILFRNKNTPESIMEIQHTYTQGALTYTSNVACICQPYPRAANSAVYDGVEIPELGDQATVWSAMRPNVYFSQGLQSKMGKDIRAKYNMAWGYGQDVQQHQHPPVVRTEVLVSEHAGLERRQQLQGLPLCRRAADDGRVLFLQGKLRKGGRIPRHDPHARQSVQVHLPHPRAPRGGDPQRARPRAFRRIPAQVRPGPLGYLVRSRNGQQRLRLSATQHG